MRELYLNVSQHFRAGKLAEGLRRHSQNLRAVVAAMAMIFIAAPFYGQTWNLVTAAADLAVGDSIIIVSGEYALGKTQNSNNRAAVAITNNGDDVEFDDEAGVQGIKLVEGTENNTFGFYVGNGYLFAASSGSNYLRTQEDLDANGSWLVTISGGETTVIAQGTNTRNNLRRNGTIFSCYSSGQTAVSIYKYEEGGPSISLTQSLVEFSYNLNNGPSAAQSFSVEGSNLTADITVSVPDDADFELCSTEDGTYASSVTITPSEGTVSSTDVFVRMKAGLDVGAYNATITIASTNATSKTINLTGSVVDPDAVYYTVVTEAPATDWTGEYLITYTNGSVVKALAGSSETSTNYGTEQDVSEYLVGNKITANATTEAIKVTARSTSNGYTLYLENVGYLGWNSSNSLEFDETVTDGRNEWTFSVSGEVVSITNVGTDTRSIKYNGSTNPKRFACYTSGQSAITLYKSPREVQELIANPTFNPAEGTFFNNVDVTLACETEGATIYYTFDDTDPTDASTEYTEAIHITETTTVKAIAIKNALSSEIVSATYTISNIETVATPVITPEAGDYNTPQQITIACATDEALVYYTTDDTDPTAESTLYTAPFTLSASATVKAIAVKEGMNNSQIASAAYTMPVFLENLAAVYSTANNAQYRILGDVTFVFRSGRYMFVKDASAGMMIYDNATSIITGTYQNGDVISGGISGKTSIYNGLYEVVPTADLAASTENNGAVEPVVVTIPQMSNENDFMSQFVTVQNLTVTGISGQNIIVTDGENTIKIFDRFNAITESNYAVDDVITSVTGFVSKYNSDYQIFPRTEDDIVKQEVPAEPTFTPAAGTYVTTVTVTLACETEGATIYYTLNDTDVQNEYATPLTFTETTTIYAFAEKNSVRSAVVSATYTITDMETVATPTITPDGGEFETTIDVTLACETADASIYYTLDGTDPTAESTLYSAPITLDATTTVKAIAVKENMHASAIAEATFTKLEPAVPVNYTRITSLSQLQDGDKVIIAARYDNDETHYYVAPSRISNKLNGVVITVDNNIISTEVDTIVWTVSIDGDNYRFTNAADANLGYGSSTNFSSSQNPDWNVAEFTAQGLVDNCSGYKITNVSTLNESSVRAVAFKSGTNVFGAYATSNANGDDYNFALDLFVDISNHTPIVAIPTITPNGGEFETTVDVTLACETEEATIYYTLNGETPTAESTLYAGPFTLEETTTVKAIAVKEGMDNSAVAEATFTKVVPTAATPTITPNGGNFEESVEVTLACETADAAIYYTLDGTDPTAESTLYAEAFTLTATTTVKAIAVKEGLASSAVAEATFTKVEPAVVVNYARIASLDQLQDGDKVIIAARYDDNADHYYVAPTRIANNRFNGVEVEAENEIISTDVDSVVWTIKIADGMYKFVNASNDTLGYGTSGTTFTSASNKEWTIAEYTNVATALVAGYAGYKITNVGNDGRSVALNAGNNNVFGAYANSNAENNNAAQYNFALDFFVDLGDHTPIVARPTFTPNGGNFEESVEVTLACATEDAAIYYTLNGETPTTESTLYAGPFTLEETTTVKAIAVKEGMTNSAVAEATFTKVVPTAATPTITPNGGNFEESVEVSLACETADASIYYTLDGTEPTAESTLYEAAFTLTETTTVKAIAVKEGLANSAVAEATFTKVEPPVVVNYTRITSLDQLQDGAKVIIASRYDDDETHYYVAPTRITGKLNGVAVTVDNSIISTDVDTIVWTVSIEGDNYRFVNAADANLGYGSSTNFSSSQNQDWNVAEFTAQGLVDNCSGYKITNVSTLNESSVRAVAFKSGTNVFGAYATSNANSDEYNFALDFFVDLGDNIPTVATPVFTPAAGYYEEAQNVTITCATEGATIYYTTDGTVPTNASTQYTEAIAVSHNTTIKAIAYVGEEYSFVATARYTFPNFVENISALYEIENTTETYILTGDVTFVYRNGKSIYVKDATGGLLVFDQSNKITTEYTEGDVISGGITGTISMYHGMLEFVPTFNTAASTQNTGAVAPTVITVEQLLSNAYVSQLVKVENVAVETGATYTEGQTGDNVTFSQNGSSALLRNNFKTLDMTIGDNTNWDITGFAAIYDENIQIYPRGNDDVTIVTSVEELASEIAIYPNPTSDIVNIVTNGSAQRVEIANVDGQIVSSEAVASDVVTISLEAQPAGMYFVRIYTANEVIVRKVTKF